MSKIKNIGNFIVKQFKKVWVRVTSISIVVVMGGYLIVSSFAGFWPFKKKNNNLEISSSDNQSTSSIVEIDPTSIDELGVEEEIKQNNIQNKQKKYGETTGTVDKNKIVEDEKGIIWVDEEAKDSSKNIGKTSTDLKGGTLEEIDGEIYEKDKGYEITDEKGNVVDSGKLDSTTKYTPNGEPIPPGKAWDPARGEIVDSKDVGKYVYDKNGDLVEVGSTNTTKKEETPKQEAPKQETPKQEAPKQEAPKQETPKQEAPKQEAPKQETPKEEPTTSSKTDEYGGITNPNGTYTILGSTYMDKATFEDFISDENAAQNFERSNGIIYPKSVLNEINNKNTLVK